MNRRAAGRLARAAGEDFEEYCCRHHVEAFRLGIVAGPVEHNEPHGKIIDGAWKMVAPGVADFTGVLYDGHGSSLAVEAKSRATRLYRREVEPRQARHLDVVVRGGGLALLLVRFAGTGGPVEFAVPWREVSWHRARSAEAVTAADIEPWRVPVSCRCYLERFCPARGDPVARARRFPRE